MEIKNIILLVIFILGIIFIQFVNAETADDIINKYIDARGGKDKLNSIKSLYMQGYRKILGIEVPVKVTIVQGKLYRIDFEFAGRSGFTIVTPTEGRSFIPMQSESIEVIAEETLKTMQDQLDITGPLFDYAGKGNKTKLQRKELVDGNEAYKIKLLSNTGKETTFYFDIDSFLLIQSRQFAETTNNAAQQEIITNYKDYTSIDGIMFPQTIQNPEDGITGGSTTFNLITVNVPVGADKYKPTV